MSCAKPATTARVTNPGTGVLAWCSGCQSWQPAKQAAWSKMRRNADGRITATYAALPH